MINNISPDALSDLTHLKVVGWKESYFPMSEFCSALQHAQKYLTIISIRADIVDTETVWASSCQHFSRLQSLRLSLKKMRTFNTTGLRFLKKLSELDLADNRLLDFSLVEIVTNLKKLSLRQNNLDSVPGFCSNAHIPLLLKLNDFSLQDNTIRYLETSHISHFENLKKLNLSQNRIKHLHDNDFAHPLALTELHLSSMTYLRLIDKLAFNFSSLAELYFTKNPHLSDRRFTPKTLFSHTQNLKILDMSHTKISLKSQDLKDLLVALTNIENLILLKTSIVTLPSGVFSQLTKLTHLILSDNNIWGRDTKVFANVTSIKHIYLDGNDINFINYSSFPVEFRLRVKEIDLANNPFCDLLWFRNWMKGVLAKKSIVFHQYPKGYQCRSPIYGVPLDAYNPTLESCNIEQPYFVFLVISLSVCIVFTVATLVTYRYRWYILYLISLMRRQRQREGPPAEMQYDGFVSYSNPDWDWVSAELSDFLEGQVGLRLCEHSRDFKAGMYIINNVIEAIDTSSKTILVISNEYMNSDWCQYELQIALSSFLKKEIDVVILLLEQIKSCNVTSSLRALMVSTTYIEWSDEPEAKNLFEARLRNAITETI